MANHDYQPLLPKYTRYPGKRRRAGNLKIRKSVKDLTNFNSLNLVGSLSLGFSY